MNEVGFQQPLDELLIQRLQRGCRRSREQVYRDYADYAWTLALRLTACEATAWDVVQESFVHAFQHVASLREPSAFAGWLRRIIVNQAMDQHRQSRRLQPLGDGLNGHERSHEPDHPSRLDLTQALNRLDPVDRMVLWLHDVEQMTHQEIAELADNTPSWSKTRLSRVRARLRTWLEPWESRPALPALEVKHAKQ